MSETENETLTPRSYEANFIGDANFANFPRFNEDLHPMHPIPNEYKISYAPTMETQIRKLRLSMEMYRELMLHINSILLWEKQWHPTAIIGACTVVFTLVWLSEPNVLTILSLMGLLVTICDYILPALISTVFKSEPWTTDKQKQYEEICTNIILYKTKLELLVTSYYRMRLTNPKLYFSFTIFGLLFLVWIGGAVSNLLLMYLLVLSLLLLPGMSSNGMLNKSSDTLSKIFTDLVENAKSKVTTKKLQ